MRELLRSTAMAFSMFSIIPVPVVGWKRENMKYMLCALPLVGAAIGAALCVWYQLCQWLNIGTFLFAVGITLIPLAISGGIHMDGFCDTVDGLSSHATPERKREILKDSHAGAFAIIFTAAYFLLYVGISTELERSLTAVQILGLHQILARGIGALASVIFPSSTTVGLLASFRDAASKRAVLLLVLLNLLCAAAIIYLAPVSGIVCSLAAVICLWYLRRMSQREFGGMSGDLAGYLITLSQLVLLSGYILTEKVVSVCF